MHAEEQGDRLSRAELQALLINLFFAGHDTTRSTLAIMLFLLATHPEQLDLLRARPDLVPAAVEEMIRYEPIISGIPRIPTVDLEVAGVHIPAGSYITLRCRRPIVIRGSSPTPTRSTSCATDNRHLGFGFGVHHCVGANVARAELQEALTVILDRCPVIETEIDDPVWVPYAGARRYRDHADAPRSRAPVNGVPAWDVETDVLVVGFGVAGACAAIEARATGADVLVLERAVVRVARAGSRAGTSTLAAAPRCKRRAGTTTPSTRCTTTWSCVRAIPTTRRFGRTATAASSSFTGSRRTGSLRPQLLRRQARHPARSRLPDLER